MMVVIVGLAVAVSAGLMTGIEKTVHVDEDMFLPSTFLNPSLQRLVS